MSAGSPRACLVRVHGRVQGVGFREACVAQARRLGVAGWVRNRADGTVEALLQGPDDVLATLRDWLAHGPPAARVDELAVEEVAPAALAGFERRPTA